MKQKDGLYQRKAGGPYYAIVIRDGKRVCESTGTTLKTEAKAFLDDMRTKVRKGTYKTPTERREATAHATTVRGLADKWLSVYIATTRNAKGQALSKYRATQYLKPFMGDVPAVNVSKDTLRQYRIHLEGLKVTDEKGNPVKNAAGEETRLLSAQTVGHILADCRCLFSWAHDMGYIGHLPIPRKLLPQIPEREPRGLSHDEQVKLSALEGPHGLACRIMIGVGVRWSELCRLTSADLKAGELVIQGETKSKKMRRVPVPPVLLGELRKHVGKLVPFEQHENPTFSRSVQRKSGLEDFSSHRCRHSFALNYVEQGGNIRVLQQFMGHASLETTEIYLRISQQTARDDARKVMGWSATA